MVSEIGSRIKEASQQFSIGTYMYILFESKRSVGGGCHAVPRTAVGRDVCTNEVGKVLVGKSSDSYFVYFASLRSE